MSWDASNLLERTARVLSANQRAVLKQALGRRSSFKQANQTICELTGIRSFFPSDESWRSFREALASNSGEPVEDSIREYGDFQTPLALGGAACQKLFDLGYRPTILVEPTCGRGNLIISALNTFPSIRKVYGLDVQEAYVTECKTALLPQSLDNMAGRRDIQILSGSVFDHDFPPEIVGQSNERVLILGNPPWVTSSTLSQLTSANVPQKTNFKKFKGLDALTGKSNFDIAEFILLHLIRSFENTNSVLGMFCKSIVARNLVHAMGTLEGLPLAKLRAFTIDAAKEFGVACDAVFFVADISDHRIEKTCAVTDLRNPAVPERSFGWVGKSFVADTEKYAKSGYCEGESPFVWRQGVKHDCSKVMELDVEGGSLKNGLAESVEAEPERIFPLAKSSDLKTPIIEQLRKAVIMTQNGVGMDTRFLQNTNPKLWNYLSRHTEAFAARKSSIYKDKPPFSIFGVGDYSFKPFKVATSGLYKTSHFSLLVPIMGKPVMLDDTCYFIGFDELKYALVAFALLNSQPVQDFLGAIVFSDSKRPYTKDILMRIDLVKVSELVPFAELISYLASVHAPSCKLEEKDLEFLSGEQNGETQELLLLEKRSIYSTTSVPKMTPSVVS